MTRDRAMWLGVDVVVLRGASVRRVCAALELALRSHQRNGREMPSDVQWDLAVLRAAADAARAQVQAPAEPDGFAGSRPEVSPADDRVMDAFEVAAAIGKSPQYARRLCRDRFRTARRVGREWRVSAAEVEAFVRDRQEA